MTTNCISISIHLNLSERVQIEALHSDPTHWVRVGNICIFCQSAESADTLAAALEAATLKPEAAVTA